MFVYLFHLILSDRDRVIWVFALFIGRPAQNMGRAIEAYNLLVGLPVSFRFDFNATVQVFLGYN